MACGGHVLHLHGAGDRWQMSLWHTRIMVNDANESQQNFFPPKMKSVTRDDIHHFSTFSLCHCCRLKNTGISVKSDELIFEAISTLNKLKEVGKNNGPLVFFMSLIKTASNCHDGATICSLCSCSHCLSLWMCLFLCCGRGLPQNANIQVVNGKMSKSPVRSYFTFKASLFCPECLSIVFSVC